MGMYGIPSKLNNVSVTLEQPDVLDLGLAKCIDLGSERISDSISLERR